MSRHQNSQEPPVQTENPGCQEPPKRPDTPFSQITNCPLPISNYQLPIANSNYKFPITK